MLVAVAAVVVEVTNSSRKLCPAPMPLGMYCQPGWTVCAVCASAGRSESAIAAMAAKARTAAVRSARLSTVRPRARGASESATGRPLAAGPLP